MIVNRSPVTVLDNGFVGQFQVDERVIAVLYHPVTTTTVDLDHLRRGCDGDTVDRIDRDNRIRLEVAEGAVVNQPEQTGAVETLQRRQYDVIFTASEQQAACA